ncbi:MAG TPA: tetratricopeptide repeat protein, partial [Anaeromyxobacteraceae bacterium]|nr:tetratricopeptide repeat protein [Anaeromyxobacteraceae bacterium]
MRRTSAVMLALALATLARPAEAAPDEPAVVAGLVRNAWYWQARAREDKAEEAWRHVLEAAPDHPEALAALGGFHARAGRAQQARETLARLEKVSPGHPDVPVLRRQLQLGTRVGPLLAQARRLVHEGHPEEGAAQYRALFGESGPPGDLALEYYQTVGGTPGGWEQARDGLRRLTRRAPAEARYQLELGKLLSYRGETRREGIAILSTLASDRASGKEATAAWRQALLWANPATDLPLLVAYARGHPADAEIARRIEHGRTATTIGGAYAALERGELREAERLFRRGGDDREAKRGLAILGERRLAAARKAGFAALERGDLREAESRFQAAGDDADARLGLALVAQREALSAQRAGELPRARELLERARRLAPARPELWREPLREVAFWQLLEEGRAARKAGRAGEAEGRLRAARDAAPERDRWHAELELANLELARRNGRAAEGHYREVLSAVPEQPEALRGLAGLLVEDGRFEEALPVNDRLVRVAPEQAFRTGWLRAEGGRARARKTRAAGDLSGARAELEGARRADGSDVWVLHDLANVLLELRDPEAARPVVADLLRVAPALPESRALEARLLDAEGRPAEALEALSHIAPPPRDPPTVALRRRLEVMVQVPALVQQALGGGRSAAVQALAALEARVKDEPELAARVAVGWSKLGENRRAVALMRTAVARAPTTTASMRLELASALLQAREDAAVGDLLRGLEHDPSLGEPERRWLRDLRVAHAVRTADQAGEAGQPGTALAALGPV